MSQSLALDLFGDPVSDPAQRKSQSSVVRLLRDIAACREDIQRREAFAAELEARVHRELEPLESQMAKVRLETFRILVGHVQADRLRKRARERLVEALCEFADELAYEHGFDVEKEMRSIIPEDEFEEAEEFMAALFDGPEDSENPGRPGGPGSTGASGRSGPSGSAGASGSANSRGRPEIPDDPFGLGDEIREGSRRRGRKPQGAKSKAALKREADEASLAGDIRALYLLLARALHPDKESDAARVAEKTAWMQQVTSAYQARDLGRLLDILARNPLDAVGPYLSSAPAKTVQGFAKRLRRELEGLRRKALQVGEHFHPVFADFVRKGRVDEAEFRRFQGEMKRKLRFFKERRDAYREVPAVMEMLGLLKQMDWRFLM